MDTATASNWIAVGALVLSLLNSAVLLFAGLRRRRAHQAAGPIEEVRARVTHARDLVEAALSNGGQDQDWYHDNDIRGLETELADFEKRIGDATARRHLSDLVGNLSVARLASPEPAGPRSYNLGEPQPPQFIDQDRDIAQRMAQTQPSLTSALQSAEAALERLNVLERRLH